MLEKFDLAALLTIDGGRIKAAFDQAVAACERDCKDRPALVKFRTVTPRRASSRAATSCSRSTVSRYGIEVSIYIDTMAKKVELRTRTDDIERVLDSVLQEIGVHLAGAGITALRGTPSLGT